MLIRKVTKANYRYTGSDGEFYKTGETYYLTVHQRRFLWKEFVEVTCRHGYQEEVYPWLPTIIYSDKSAFEDDWIRI